jgi:hypothetical protein
MDRMYDSTFGSSLFRSPASLSRWNPAVNVYQDKDQFFVVAELKLPRFGGHGSSK